MSSIINEALIRCLILLNLGSYTIGYFISNVLNKLRRVSQITYEMTTSERFCLSYDCLKWDFIVLKVVIISTENIRLSRTAPWRYAPVTKCYIIRIFNGCGDKVENSITRITLWNHKVCRVMPNSYPEWRGFRFALNNHYTAVDSFSCIHFLRQLHLK